MIYATLANVRDFLGEDIKINETVKNRIEKSASESEKKLRTVAYHALFLTLERFFRDGTLNVEKVELRYTGAGKPYVTGFDCDNNCLQNMPSVSVSHDKGVAVVAVSDFQRIGVDIQGDSIPKRRMERIAARFLSSAKKEERETEQIGETIKWFLAKENAIFELTDIDLVKEISKPAENLDFLSKWTRLEAVMKASGGGFADYPNIEELLLSAQTKSFLYADDGEEYVVTIAK